MMLMQLKCARKAISFIPLQDTAVPQKSSNEAMGAIETPDVAVDFACRSVEVKYLTQPQTDRHHFR